MTVTTTVAVGDGSICFKEFKLIQSQCEAGRQRLLSQQSRDAEQRLRTAFKVFDIDGNGFIDMAELRATLAELDSCVSLPDAEALLRAADKNGDGQIDYEGKASDVVEIIFARRRPRPQVWETKRPIKLY